MGKLGGGLFVAAIIAVGVWVTFLHPDYRPNVAESVDWTRACADGTGGVSINETKTKLVRKGLGEGDALVLAVGGEQAAVFFLPSRGAALRAQRELRGYLRQQTTASEQQLAGRVFQRDALLLAYTGPNALPSRAALAGFGRCAVEVSEPHYKSLAFFQSKTIGHPFAAAHG